MTAHQRDDDKLYFVKEMLERERQAIDEVNQSAMLLVKLCNELLQFNIRTRILTV
tara:strand:+ start:2707 stop:2871 length:165 start_codon:yes stop_codon:yes gene_type:complete